MSKKDSIKALFEPNAICIVGASSSPGKTGNFAMRSAAICGVPIYPINPGGMEEIMGHRVYSTIEDIPVDNVELFLFVIPQHAIKASLISAINKGCRAAVIFSAGFKEAGAEGAKLQEELKQIADEADIKIVGPNTLGYLRGPTKVNATFEPQYSDLFKNQGDIALLMQSGGVGVISMSRMMEQSIPFGTFIALGNRLNLEFADMLNFFAEDEYTKVVCVAIEATDDLRMFYEAAVRCAKIKPVIILSGGVTDSGRISAGSHTGTMASSAKIYEAAYRQAGVVQVNSVSEMICAAKMLSMNPPPKGDKIAVLMHLAGPSVLLCDKMEQGGLQLAELSEQTKIELEKQHIIPDFVTPVNPIDLAAFGKMKPSLFVDGAKVLVEDEGIDGIITVSASPLADKYAPKFPFADFGDVIKKANIPAAVVWGAYYADYQHEFKAFQDAGIAAFPTPDEAAIAYSNYVKYYKLRARDNGEAKVLEFGAELEKLISEGKGTLSEHDSKAIMEAAGIKTASTKLAVNADDAKEAAEKIGYPVVLKVDAENITHKSDMGGVRLNILNKEQVEVAFEDIKSKALAIENSGFMGVTVQPMLPEGGQEIIIGAMQDPQAGPVVMAGLGGIFVEVLKDVSFRLAPVTANQAKEMLGDLKGAAILKGVRGSEAINEDMLADIIVRVSHLIATKPIKEIDINPVICYGGTKYYAADARVIMK